jgi:hypothetical protein
MTDSTKSWAKQIVDAYELGCSDAEVAAELKVTIKEYYRQITDNPTFAKLVEYGRTLSQAFWEGQARKNLSNKQFNTPLWAFYMKNKFAWADKTESVNSNENVNTDLDSLRQQVNKDVQAFIKKNSPELTDAQVLLSDIGKAANE